MAEPDKGFVNLGYHMNDVLGIADITLPPVVTMDFATRDDLYKFKNYLMRSELGRMMSYLSYETQNVFLMGDSFEFAGIKWVLTTRERRA